MTDNTQPEALRLAEQYDYGDPATHGNAWKAAVCTELRRQHARIAELESELEAVGAGGVQALSAAPTKADSVLEDAARTLIEAIEYTPLGLRAIKAMNRLRAALAATAEQQVIIDFAQVGTAGPFHVVNGRVKLPDATMQDLARMLRPTYEAEQAVPKVDGFYEAVNDMDGLYQAAPKAAPGEPSYSEKWDAELGRTAMRFVDRAGDVHPGIDDAETICAEFYKAMSEVIERMPHVQRMAAPKAAPGEPSDAGTILAKVCDLFQIGKLAGTESTILTNVENTLRFSNMLGAVERDLFQQPDLPEDDDPYAEVDDNLPTPNKWGAKDEADYVSQFKAALLARGFTAPQQEAQEPMAIKAMGYGGSTGINDYLMSDGTIKAMRPSEVVWAAPQPAPDCHHRPPCDECAALAAQGGK